MSVATTLTTKSLAFFRQHPIQFIEGVLIDPETHVGFELLPAERAFLEHAFQIGDNGKLLYSEWLYSAPKKSGKTTFEAIVILTMTLLYVEIYRETHEIVSRAFDANDAGTFAAKVRLAAAKARGEVTDETPRFSDDGPGRRAKLICNAARRARGEEPFK
jgi:hypothetical protein